MITLETRELWKLRKLEKAVLHWKRVVSQGVSPVTREAWNAVLEALGEPPVSIEEFFYSPREDAMKGLGDVRAEGATE